MNNVIHSGRYKGVVRGCALMMWISLIGCGHLGPMQQAKQTIVCPNGEVRVLMRCDYTSVRSYQGGVDVGATGVGGQARYEETKADQDNGEARQHALALQSMCLEYNSCLLSAEEYKAAKYNFEYRRDHPEAAAAAPAARAAPAVQTPPAAAAPATRPAQLPRATAARAPRSAPAPRAARAPRSAPAPRAAPAPRSAPAPRAARAPRSAPAPRAAPAPRSAPAARGAPASVVVVNVVAAQRSTPAPQVVAPQVVVPEVVASASFEAAQAPAHPHQGKWHDAPRNIALWYICERPAAGRCQAGWRRYDRSCYKLSDNRKPFDAARASCRRQGGDLVSVDVAHENHFIAHLSQKKACWIGLDEAHGTERWRWSNGRRLGERGRWSGFSNWDRHEPNNYGGRDEDAAFINYWGYLGMPNPLARDRHHTRSSVSSRVGSRVGKWYDGPRNMKLWYVCERPNHGACQRAGWSTFGGACYMLSKSIASFDRAAAACRHVGAHLVTIESPAENAHVARLVKNHSVWIGLSEPRGSESWVWVNGVAAGERSRWRGYTNWEPNEPNNWRGRDEDVAFMNFWGHLGLPAPWAR